MNVRVLLPALALTAAGCPDKGGDTLDTDSYVVDSDVDNVGHTDTQVITDTDEPDDTEAIVDTDIPTLTIQAIRRDGAALPGDTVRILDVVVTAVRQDGTQFVVQDKTTSNYSGMVVKAGAGGLPSPGTVVTLIGIYKELGAGSPPFGTTATLDASVPGASVTPDGTTSLPTPYVTAYTTGATGQPEAYESMISQLNGSLQVATAPAGNGSFELDPPSGSSTRLPIGAWFFDPSDGLTDLGPGATFASITGLFEYDGRWTLQPTGPSDLFNYHAPPHGGGGDTDLHTDVVVHTDTFVPVDTSCDTDCGIDTGATLIEVTGTPQNVHQGVYQSDNTLVTVQDLVVTAVHDGPAAQDYFTIQTATGGANSALWVDATDTTVQGLTLPAVGDVVDVTGMYVEFNIFRGAPSAASQARLKVETTTWPQTGWTVKSHGHAMPPVHDLSVADFQNGAALELWESQLVRLIDTADLQVDSVAGPKLVLPPGTDRVWLDSSFYAMASNYTIAIGSKMTSVTGILFYRYNATPAWRLSPRSAADVVGFH